MASAVGGRGILGDAGCKANAFGDSRPRWTSVPHMAGALIYGTLFASRFILDPSEGSLHAPSGIVAASGVQSILFMLFAWLARSESSALPRGVSWLCRMGETSLMAFYCVLYIAILEPDPQSYVGCVPPASASPTFDVRRAVAVRSLPHPSLTQRLHSISCACQSAIQADRNPADT